MKYFDIKIVKTILEGKISPSLINNYKDVVNECLLILKNNNRKPSNGWNKRIAYFIFYELDKNTFVYRITTIIDIISKYNTFPITYDTMILLYGNIEGNKRWLQYCNKQSYTNSYEYKKEKYGWSEDEYKKYNKNRAITLENMQIKYGVDKGKEVYDSYCDKQKYTNTLEYYVKREKSYDNGLITYNKINKNKGNSSNIYFISNKYGISVDDAKIKLMNSRSNSLYVSKLEKIIIDKFENLSNFNIKYTYKTKQYGIWIDNLNSIVFYDAIDTNIKKGFEIYGDYWHCNPFIYNEEFVHPHRQIKAKDIWYYDEIKIKSIEQSGFLMKIVWEKDYNENPEKIIEELIEWWKT